MGTRTFAYNDSFQLWKENIEGLTPATITRLYETDGVMADQKGFAIEKSPFEGGQGDVRYEFPYGYDPSGRIKTLSLERWRKG